MRRAVAQMFSAPALRANGQPFSGYPGSRFKGLLVALSQCLDSAVSHTHTWPRWPTCEQIGSCRRGEIEGASSAIAMNALLAPAPPHLTPARATAGRRCTRKRRGAAPSEYMQCESCDDDAPLAEATTTSVVEAGGSPAAVAEERVSGARRVLSLSALAAEGEDMSAADARMLQLVAEIEQLALAVSPGVLRSAVQRVQHAESVMPADGEDSPARPRRLLLMPADAEMASAEAGSVGTCGSRGSRGVASTTSHRSSTDSGSSVNSSTVLAPGEPLFMPGVGQLWPGGATDDGPDPGGFALQAAQVAARAAAGNADGTTATDAAGAASPGGDENASEGGSSARGSEQDKPKRRRGGKGRRGGRGFGQGNDLAHGRCMVCDVCDLGSGGPQWACTAADMLQQTSMQKIREKHEAKLKTAKGRAGDPDRREARYAMYRGVVRWRWADPLGAENRVRLPMCVMQRIRRIFPNPKCGAGCDYGIACEKKGHYVGFRTAEESRAVREGRSEVWDMRD